MKRIAMLLILAVSVFPAFAAEPDFSVLTDAVDFETLVTAILGVFAAIMWAAVIWKGCQRILDVISCRREEARWEREAWEEYEANEARRARVEAAWKESQGLS